MAIPLDKLPKRLIISLFDPHQLHHIVFWSYRSLNCSVRSLHIYSKLPLLPCVNLWHHSHAPPSNVNGNTLHLCNGIKLCTPFVSLKRLMYMEGSLFLEYFRLGKRKSLGIVARINFAESEDPLSSMILQLRPLPWPCISLIIWASLRTLPSNSPTWRGFCAAIYSHSYSMSRKCYRSSLSSIFTPPAALLDSACLTLDFLPLGSARFETFYC